MKDLGNTMIFSQSWLSSDPFPKTTSARVGFWEDRPWKNAMIIPKMCVAEVSSSNTGSTDRAHFGISLRTDNDGGFFVVC